MDNWEGSTDRHELNLREVKLIEVVNIVKQLCNSSTMGHNELDALTLKLVIKTLMKPIQHIINVSIRTQTYPNKNYRPISILPLI